MTGDGDNATTSPQCVVSLLDRLRDVTEAFEAGKPLGPYLVESLLEDVDLCPALQQPRDPHTYASLHQAVEKAKQSARVAINCTTAERDWAAKDMRAAVARAQECLEEWREKVLAEAGKSDDKALAAELERIGALRCPTCAFATPFPGKPASSHG